MGSKASYDVDIDGSGEAGGVDFAPVGGQFIGTATVTPEADTKLNSLSVQLVWKAHGKGDPEESIVSKVQATGVNALVAGETTKIPFEFTIPERGPITYDGDCVKVEWEIRIYLDIPWGTDDSASFPVLVMARPDE